MGRYDAEIRKPEDILFRSSRPQRNSSHIPRARDWRYATGVFRHEDIVDVRSESTVWDIMDRDFNVRKTGGKRKGDDRDERKDEVHGEGIWYHENLDDEVSGDGGREEKKTPSPRKKTKSPTDSPKKGIPKKGSRAVRVGIFNFKPTGDTGPETGERKYIQTGLIVRLKLAGKTPVCTPKRHAEPSVSTPKKLHRPATPTMGFRASGAPPTPPSTIKSVSRGWSKDSPPPRYDSDTSYVKINTSDETVTTKVVMPIRNVFTFPLLAIIAMAGEGVKMGLEKASQRKKVREEEELRKAKSMETDILEVTPKPYHVPEISRKTRDSASPPRKDNEVKKPCGTPQVSRELRGTMASPQEQHDLHDLHEPNRIVKDDGGPQDAAALLPNEIIVLEEPQTTGSMTPLTNNAALTPKSISPHPMLRVSEQDRIEVAHPSLALYPSKTMNMVGESPIPNAPSRAPMAVEETAEAPVKMKETSDVAKRSRILETLRQAQDAALEPLKKCGDAIIDKYPATAEQAQTELEQRLNVLLEQEEEQESLTTPDMHAEQARTEREKSETPPGKQEKQGIVAIVEDLLPSIEQAQAELEQRRRILLEKMEKQADVSKLDHVLAQGEVIPAPEARSGQIKEYTGGNVQDHDGSAPGRKATLTEEAEAEMKDFFDDMVEKVNAAPVCSSASQLPPQLPAAEAPSLPLATPQIDYDTHGNPIPRIPKRALHDEHANGIRKKSKMMPSASSSNVISNRAWHRDGAPRAPRTANYHSRGSQQHLGSRPHPSSRYPSGATQPYRRTQASSAARPYSCAQYQTPSNFGGNHGSIGGRSYPHAYHPSAALLSGNNGPYNVQQYKGPTVGAGLHYSGALTRETASTPQGGTKQGNQNLQREKGRGHR